MKKRNGRNGKIKIRKVYFLLDRSSCALKIGATDQPRKRIAELQVGCPNKLELLGTLNGSEELEESLHQQFSNWRKSGEWFRYDDELQVEVREILKYQANLPTQIERNVLITLIGLLEKYGCLAFSRQGPQGDMGADDVHHMIFLVWKFSGEDAMDRLFEAVEEYACKNFSPLQASAIGGSLDHRFDGIGGWYA